MLKRSKNYKKKEMKAKERKQIFNYKNDYEERKATKRTKEK